MFPDPTAVFVEPVSEHAAVLFPIFSIDLSVIEPTWNGQLHMLLFNYDPYNKATVVTFTEHCKDNSMGFDVVEGRYRFQTSFAFFDLQDNWKEWFRRTREGFGTARDHYRLSNELPGKASLIDQIGGMPDWIQNDETPLDPDGEPMRFIAKVTSYNYADDMCGRILYLFYSHTHQLAVIVDQCD
jgi:hypothetical protein